jgi:heptosyltransferase-2
MVDVDLGDMAENKRILIIELAGIGDIVLSSPAIRNLRQNYPDYTIYFLSFSRTTELLKKSPYIDKVYELRRGITGFMNNIVVISELRRLQIEIAISMYQHYAYSGLINMISLLTLIRPKKTLGRNTNGKGFFYDMKIEDAIDTNRHEVQTKLALIRVLGCDIKDEKLEIWFDDSDTRQIDDFLRSNRVLESDLLIGINPGGFRPSRRWDWERFAEVCDILAREHKAKIVITGSKSEIGLAKKIEDKMDIEPIDSTGKLSLTQLAALISRCNLYISNDSGPMHIANALETPLVAIIGPGMTKIAPYQEKNCIILKKRAECSPCYKFDCRDMRCLKNIIPDEVIGAADTLLKNNVKD